MDLNYNTISTFKTVLEALDVPGYFLRERLSRKQLAHLASSPVCGSGAK